jgi:hypothetical protein
VNYFAAWSNQNNLREPLKTGVFRTIKQLC